MITEDRLKEIRKLLQEWQPSPQDVRVGRVKAVDELLSEVYLSHKNDDPELDATDYAHPAWWRGEEHAVEMLVHRMEKILDGKDSEAGIMGHAGLEKVRRRIIELVKFKKAAVGDGT